MQREEGVVMMRESTARLVPDYPVEEEVLRESTPNILLIEDNNADAILTKIALDAAKIPYALTRIKRGDEVIPSLRQNYLYYPLKMPDVILLDLGLPGSSGFDILAELTEMHPAIRAVPIVILTGHRHFEYLRNTYQLCIQEYINKPCKAHDLQRIMKRILHGKTC
jgi:two-component system, chemotaxis family, response regulator Rcp1